MAVAAPGVGVSSALFIRSSSRSTMKVWPKTDVALGLRHAGQDGHSGRTRVEELSFVLALPLSTAVSRLVWVVNEFFVF